MLAEALEALAATAGTALVTVMVTDGWEGARARFARLLGRGDPARTQPTAPEGNVAQYAVALDQAQQAVQGHGVQNNTFGGQHGSSASR